MNQHEAHEEMQMDLAGAKEASGLGSRQPVPPGEYLAEFSALEELGITKNGFPQVAGEWRIEGGEADGLTVREWIVFAPKAAPFIKRRMQALGIPLPSATGVTAVALYFAKKAAGRVALITVAHAERADGRVFAEVVDIRPAKRTAAPAAVAITDDDEEVPF